MFCGSQLASCLPFHMLQDNWQEIIDLVLYWVCCVLCCSFVVVAPVFLLLSSGVLSVSLFVLCGLLGVLWFCLFGFWPFGWIIKFAFQKKKNGIYGSSSQIGCTYKLNLGYFGS
ncbi:hypothetical protein Dsin_003096 [Dipteronia sinensis]|uniref:Uncharacterized protein n=1 Tax=Dipteronia sinensis TaxID=43782 RepID=A0AAE0B8I3_9ROSI|nr:hypothetical protein Dsin_003096 [Dipteronia sinensis]